MLFDCDGVAGKGAGVRFEDCKLATRLFQIGSEIRRRPRTTMLLARRTPRKTMTRITARRDMKPLQLLLAVSVKTNLQLSRKKSGWILHLCLPTGSVSDAIPDRGGATLENIHLYLYFPDFDRAIARLGG